MGTLCEYFESKSCSKLTNAQNRSDPSMYVSTGMYGYDKIVGRPGLLKGHFYSILGSSQSFKSYAVGEIIASCIGYNMKNFGEPGYHLIKDTEKSYSPDFFDKRGIDPDLVLMVNARSIWDLTCFCTDMFTEFKSAYKTKRKSMNETDVFRKTPVNTFFIDTVSAMPTEMDLESKKMQNAAIEISTFGRCHQDNIYDYNFLFFLIYQEKDQLKMNKYEPINYDKKGRGIKPGRFHSEVMFQTTRKNRYENSVTYSISTKSKNRLREGFDDKEVLSEFVYGKGINDSIAILDSALEMGLVRKKAKQYEIENSLYPADEAARIISPEVFKNEYAFMSYSDYNPYAHKSACIYKGVDSDELPVEVFDNEIPSEE